SDQPFASQRRRIASSSRRTVSTDQTFTSQRRRTVSCEQPFTSQRYRTVCSEKPFTPHRHRTVCSEQAFTWPPYRTVCPEQTFTSQRHSDCVLDEPFASSYNQSRSSPAVPYRPLPLFLLCRLFKQPPRLSRHMIPGEALEHGFAAGGAEAVGEGFVGEH